MDLSSLPNILLSLLTLTFLEIVLGVDNLVFISIVSNRLPEHQQKNARRLGLVFALFTRLLLLASIVWIVGLTKPLFSFLEYAFSARDLLLIIGGAFLLIKGTLEIHREFEEHMAPPTAKAKFASFSAVVIQIAIFDIIFSLDSILTAIGLTHVYWVMATAITIAIITMIFLSEPLSNFIKKHSTIKILALSFLLLIGMVLVADGLQFHIPRGYIYFAICFSVGVETLNSLLAKKSLKKSRS